ncbi:MAG: ABC transporter permease [Gemmatimonadaceae bacterium]
MWAVISREYLERVRSPWFVVATVFGPVFFGLLMYLPAYMASRSQASTDVARIRVLDVTGTEIGSRIASALNGGVMGDTSLTQVVRLTRDELAAAETLATRAVVAQALKGYLVLSRSPAVGITARYAGANATAIADMQRLEAVTQREVLAVQLRAAGVTEADADRLTRSRFSLTADRITPSGRGGSGSVSLFFALSVAMLLYMTILVYGQNVLRGVIEEKQTRVAEIVLSSVSSTTLLAGKVLGVGAVGLTQILIWLSTARFMFDYRAPMLRRLGLTVIPLQLPHITPVMLALLILFFVLGYTLYAAMFAVVGAMVSSEHEAQQAQLPVILLLVMSIVFLQPVMSAPDGRLATTLAMIPFSAPIVMPLRMSSINVPWWDLGLSLLSLSAASYLAIYVAARIYRTGLLMYGKRASLRELARWVRQSG